MPAAAPTWWGWHQLADPWAKRLAATAGIRPGTLVLDVGAGTGAITKHLVSAGARVIAIELHPQRAEVLRKRFAADDKVKVVCADASDLRLPRRPFQVVANPPFGITTALLRRLLGPSSQLVRADIVLPRHAAARWATGRDRHARRWTTTFELVISTRVPSRAFNPLAPDGAAILTITRRPADQRRPAARLRHI